MSAEKQVTIIAGSPKAPGTAVSDKLSQIAAETLGDTQLRAQVFGVGECMKENTTEKAYAAMAQSDAVIVVFPLYVFCLPGITMRFLQDYLAYHKVHAAGKKQMVYSVINCGFPEPEINEEASRVVARFAAAIGAQYGHGILIGSGGMIGMSVSPAEKLRDLYRAALRDVQAEIKAGKAPTKQSVCLETKFPRCLYFLFGHMGWRRWIRRNGKSGKDLYARPYQPV